MTALKWPRPGGFHICDAILARRHSRFSHFGGKISDGKLKFVNVNYPQPLTYKFLFICLTKFIKDEKKISEIINFIKSEREIKSITEIKRS